MAKTKWIAVRQLKLKRLKDADVRALNPGGVEGMPCVRVKAHDGGRPRAKDGYIEQFSERCDGDLDRIAKKRALIEGLRAEGYWVVNEPGAATHSVYVIRLDEAIRDHPKVGRLNPGASDTLPCYYVGQTSKTPAERLRQHQEGENPSRWVRDFTEDPSSGLVPELYEHLNPMSEDDALEKEADLGESLRAAGHVVTGGH